MKLFFFLLAVLCACTLPAFSQEWRVQPVSSLQKITARQRGVLQSFPSAPAQLKAARGEWENFQIVITAGEKELKNVRLKSTPLATHLGEIIPTKNIQLYRENFVFVEQPSGNRILEKLWWPDALIPLAVQPTVNIAAGKSEVFWVSIQAPQNAAPGEYFGEIDISADGEKPRRLFVSTQVEDVQMPKPTMRATVAVYYDVLRDWYAKNLDKPFDEKLKKQYYEFLLDFRINAYDLPVDWSTPDAAKYLRDDRVLSVRLPPLDGRENLETAIGVLRANNALHKNFYYWIDEPAPQRYDEIHATTKQLHALDSQIKQLATIHPNQSLQGAVDIWCPNIGDYFGLGHLDPFMLAAERRKGRETWWYTMVEPRHPYPTWLLDDDAISVRMYGALMARYGITGFVYSMAHGWGPQPLENLQSFAGTNGDGTLLYPAEIVGGSGPMPSIRLMLLRDAIEDYELIQQLPTQQRSVWHLHFMYARRPFESFRRPDEHEQWHHWMLQTLARKKVPGLLPFPSSGTPMVAASTPVIQAPTIDGELQASEWNPAIAQESMRHSSGHILQKTKFWLTNDDTHLFIAFSAEARTLEKEWCAVELAPLAADERFRFVVTARGNGVVERHTREGRFWLEGLEWKYSARKSENGYDVEMQIPLEIIGNAKSFRFNALRQIGGSTPVLTRAFADAGDVTLMPQVTLLPFEN